jgi:hypothetical protein
MAAFVVDFGTKMTCPHGGTVTFLPAGPPIATINGMQVATVADQLLVTGCSLANSSPPTPCTTVQWANVGTMLVGGKAVLLQSTPPPGPGNGLCVGSPTAVPPVLQSIQQRVTGM